MKKLIAVLIILILVGVLFGCTQAIDDETETIDDNGETETIDNAEQEVIEELDSGIIDEDDDISVGEMY